MNCLFTVIYDWPLRGVNIYVGICILQILMMQNMNFEDKTKIFVMLKRKDPNRGPQNRQKCILQQKNVVAGKNMPYVVRTIQIQAQKKDNKKSGSLHCAF